MQATSKTVICPDIGRHRWLLEETDDESRLGASSSPQSERRWRRWLVFIGACLSWPQYDERARASVYDDYRRW